jgi:hypothetical protein
MDDFDEYLCPQFIDILMVDDDPADALLRKLLRDQARRPQSVHEDRRGHPFVLVLHRKTAQPMTGTALPRAATFATKDFSPRPGPPRSPTRPLFATGRTTATVPGD